MTSTRRQAITAAGLVVGALAVATVAVLLVADRGEDDPAVDGALGAALAPGVEHVHGLGVDPTDGALFVATHFGTFRIPERGAAVRVGDSYQDTMGFTVAGPGRFLGSGHPDVKGMRAGQPTLLGLIESTDGAATWRSLSLSGEVDFHALAYADGRIYGWDSTSRGFMVSEDMKMWQTRAVLDLYAFAVDPDTPQHLIGATPDGIVESTDDGRTWAPIPGPALQTLSWDPRAGLWGATTDGTVHHSTDAAATWNEAGRLPGEPQALLATDEGIWAAADDEGTTGIYRSVDEGKTWTLRYRDPEA